MSLLRLNAISFPHGGNFVPGSMLKCLGTFTTFDRNNLKLLTQRNVDCHSFFYFLRLSPVLLPAIYCGFPLPFHRLCLFGCSYWRVPLFPFAYLELRSRADSFRNIVFDHVWIRRFLQRGDGQVALLFVLLVRSSTSSYSLYSI
jgi:hypothetical protein